MGRGGKGKFSFRRTNSHARGARNLDEVSPSSASAISRGNEMKKWRANSHNKADNRAIKITFARPKKAKRNQKKKKGERKTRISRPIPLLGHLGARVEKFLLCGNHLRSSTRERATRRHPSFFFRRNAHTHFPNTSFTHIYIKSDTRT